MAKPSRFYDRPSIERNSSTDMQHDDRPMISLATGDPAGISPELTGGLLKLAGFKERPISRQMLT